MSPGMEERWCEGFCMVRGAVWHWVGWELRAGQVTVDAGAGIFACLNASAFETYALDLIKLALLWRASSGQPPYAAL